MPSPLRFRAKHLPFDTKVEELAARLAAAYKLRTHYVTNTVERVRPGSTLEKDYDVPTPPNVRAVGWLDDLSLRYLSGEVGCILEDEGDLRSIALLMHVNKRAVFHVDFAPSADPDFVLKAALLLLPHPRVRLRDHVFDYIAGRPRPAPAHYVLWGYDLSLGVDYRPLLVRQRPVRYTVVGTSYIASGWFTPENDPLIKYLEYLTSTRPGVVILDQDAFIAREVSVADG